MAETENLIDLTVEIVTAYVQENRLNPEAVPELIQAVHASLAGLASGEGGDGSGSLVPSVPVAESVLPDHIVCLECGDEFQSLKRHLRTAHDLTPDSYRDKWQLRSDYPMVAPNYSKTRSKLARQSGLGRARG